MLPVLITALAVRDPCPTGYYNFTFFCNIFKEHSSALVHEFIAIEYLHPISFEKFSSKIKLFFPCVSQPLFNDLVIRL